MCKDHLCTASRHSSHSRFHKSARCADTPRTLSFRLQDQDTGRLHSNLPWFRSRTHHAACSRFHSSPGTRYRRSMDASHRTPHGTSCRACRARRHKSPHTDSSRRLRSASSRLRCLFPARYTPSLVRRPGREALLPDSEECDRSVLRSQLDRSTCCTGYHTPRTGRTSRWRTRLKVGSSGSQGFHIVRARIPRSVGTRLFPAVDRVS